MGKIIEFGYSDNLIASDVIFYDVKDVSRELKCSMPKAREIMHRADFPFISTGKNMKVSKAAFEAWAMERRV